MNEEYPFASNYFKVGKHRIHYIDQGQGPVVVLLHGNPTWSFFYRKVIRLLSGSHRVIAVDHLGCGRSDKPQKYNYTLENHINNLLALLDGLEISSYAMMVHDWGGAIGFGAGVKYPERLEKIVVLNTAAFRSKKIPFRIAVCKTPLLGELLVRGLNGFAWPAAFMATAKKMPDEIKKQYILPYDSWQNRIAIHRFVKDIPMHKGHISYQTLLNIEQGLGVIEQMKIPMQIIWGGRDFCFNDFFYDEWKRRFPAADCHYFANAGHYVLEDEWDKIEPLLKNFFIHR
ncbi:MAG: alpha/beta hydrolase [Deltaproteobacteria bacterium]|nr:MAG: alpha/beta hydrolase [Deltaproteobacteria bacterium]